MPIKKIRSIYKLSNTSVIDVFKSPLTKKMQLASKQIRLFCEIVNRKGRGHEDQMLNISLHYAFYSTLCGSQDNNQNEKSLKQKHSGDNNPIEKKTKTIDAV